METRQANAADRVNVFTATDGRDILVNSPDGWEVDQPWLWWIDGDGTWGNPPPGASDWAGQTALPAVTRATNLICSTIAGLPWDMHRSRDSADPSVLSATDVFATPDWVSDPQAQRQDYRIHGPASIDATLSAVEFWTNFLISALWWGDGYVYVPARNVDGTPRPPLYQLHPGDVSIRDGVYWANDVDLAADQIIHLRGDGPYWDGHGRGVLTRHAIDLGLALTVRQYTASTYRSGVPAGYLQSTQPHMTEDDAKALKRAWMENHGRGRRSIAVLNATTTFTPIAVSPVDAALDTVRRATTQDIANMFGVPAHMLGDTATGNTYSNAESRGQDFVSYTLRPWIDRLESCLGAEFPRGTALRIDTRRFERADTATTSATLLAQLAAGVVDAEEVRRVLNLPTGAGTPGNVNPTPVPSAFLPGGP